MEVYRSGIIRTSFTDRTLDWELVAFHMWMDQALLTQPDYFPITFRLQLKDGGIVIIGEKAP